MAKIIIDAEGEVRGRLASFAAKQALQGNEIVVLNSEKALISGNIVMNIQDFKLRRALNTNKPEKGPFFSKDPEKMLKRTIRGMLPDFRIGKGREAWKRIRCYIGVPEEFKKEKPILSLNRSSGWIGGELFTWLGNKGSPLPNQKSPMKTSCACSKKVCGQRDFPGCANPVGASSNMIFVLLISAYGSKNL